MQTVKINNLARWSGRNKFAIMSAVERVVDRGWYLLGPELEAFEREFAAYCEVSHCIGVGNGTDALEIAVRALDCGPGDEIITAANTGMYSSAAIIAAGATPIFVDVDPAKKTISSECVRAALTCRTRAVIVTHLFGQAADVDEIRSAAEPQKIAIIEDCAQAHGAFDGGRKVGSIGAIGCFSFYPTKNLGGIGDGGALTTHDSELALKIRRLSQYGWTKRYVSDLSGGRNSRLDEIQAAVLRLKLSQLDAMNYRRKKIAARYKAIFCGAKDISSLLRPDYVAHLFVLTADHRDLFREFMLDGGIETDVHYPIPDYKQLAMRRHVSDNFSLHHTERLSQRIVTIPCFPDMTDDEVEAVCRRLSAARENFHLIPPGAGY